MSPSLVYLDASAAVKLVVREAQSRALAAALETVTSWVSSRVLLVELSCTAQRIGLPAGRAAWVLDRCDLLDVDAAVMQRAAEPFSPAQRALHAIHLASALSLPEPPVFVSYDDRQLDGARAAGLICLNPA